MSGRRAVLALGLALASVGVWAACSGGLKLTEGNAFPCHYDVSEDVRDAQCPENWRCGIDATCHPAVDELALLGNEPTYVTSRRFPKVLTGAAKFVSGEPQEQQLLVGYEDGSAYRTDGRVVHPVSLPEGTDSAALVGSYLLVKSQSSPTSSLTVYDFPPSAAAPASPRSVQEGSVPVLGIEGVRTLSEVLPAGPRVAISLLRPLNLAGEVDPVTAQYKPFPPSFEAMTNGTVVVCTGPNGQGCPGTGEPITGSYDDVRYVPAGQLGLNPSAPLEPLPVVLTPTRILVRVDASGSWRVLNPTDALVPSTQTVGSSRGLLRHDSTAGLWAVRRTIQGKDVLTTLSLARATQRLTRTWSDCAPCGSGKLISFTPLADGSLGVEVLCKTASNTLSLARVIGSSVLTSTDACLLQPLEPPVALKDVSGLPETPVVDEAHGGGLVLGGKHGQLWTGNVLSRLRPVFLDRAPVAAELLFNGLMAFTPSFVAVDLSSGSADGPGLTALAPGQQTEEDGQEQVVGLGNLVEGSPAWILLASGQVVRMDGSSDTLAVSAAYGPKLVGSRGEPITGPFLGQGVKIDDNRFSLVLTANDQLYYAEVDKSLLSGAAEAVDVLPPKLSPDPNFPIISLARDRTVSLTSNDGARVRGWVATGRAVFTFHQEAATKGWAVKQLSLGESEPVEVWTHEQDTASHGRVGLRSGEVLSLPDGLPLTQLLPDKKRATDYASLNGWPIVLTSTGVYHGVKTQRADGKPGLLAWQPLELPSTITEADLVGARVRVVKEPTASVLYLFTNNGFVYQLGRI